MSVALIERVGARGRAATIHAIAVRDELRRQEGLRAGTRAVGGLLALLKAGGVVEVFFETTGVGQSDDFWFRLGATLAKRPGCVRPSPLPLRRGPTAY